MFCVISSFSVCDSKRWFPPVHGMQSNRVLVEIHNSWIWVENIACKISAALKIQPKLSIKNSSGKFLQWVTKNYLEKTEKRKKWNAISHLALLISNFWSVEKKLLICVLQSNFALQFFFAKTFYNTALQPSTEAFNSPNIVYCWFLWRVYTCLCVGWRIPSLSKSNFLSHQV